MTDQEKIIRHDTLELLRQKIGGSFGCADGIFAGHKSDEDRAKELRKLALKEGITLEEIIEISLGYLFRKEYCFEQISKQIK